MSVQASRRGALLAITCLVAVVLISRLSTTEASFSSSSAPLQVLLSSHHKECSNVEKHPDQCAFVMKACKGFSRFYLSFYYCSELWRPISMTLLISGLLMLFGAVSVAASDFFWIDTGPNLQTISAKLQLSESMAGVTVLAFGNGSTDLFSTFSAMDTGAGSLAIGELIGAAFFIVSVVSGCMGIIRPFKSERITFMRDASFLTGAIMMLTWIVYHQRIFWYHGVALISYYLTYVLVVVFGAFQVSDTETAAKLEYKASAYSGVDPDQLTEAARLLQHEAGRPPRLSIPIHGFPSQHSVSSYESHIGHVIRPVSSNSSYRSSLHIDGMNMPRTTSTNGSISTRLSRHAMTPRVGIRTSVFSAIEASRFQEQVSTIRRTGSTHSTLNRRRVPSSPMWNPRTSHPTLGLLGGQGSSSSNNYNNSLGPPSASSSTARLGRPRSSTVGDRLMPTGARHTTPASGSPDSSHSSTGIAEDYFTYISANHDKVPEIRLPTALLQVGGPGAIYNHDGSTDENPQQQHMSQDVTLAVPPLPPTSSRPASVLATTVPESWWTVVEEAFQILFPTLQNWRNKSAFAKLSSLLAAPVVLVLTLTLPVAEDVQIDDVQVVTEEEDDDAKGEYLGLPNEDVIETLSVGGGGGSTYGCASGGGGSTLLAQSGGAATEDLMMEETLTDGQPWSRWLLATQAVMATTFIFVVMALNEFISPVYIWIGVCIGGILASVVLLSTSSHQQPSWYWMTSFAGFAISLNWIFLLANEMVGLLQALGTILSISDAIMGLTIFAVGNSVGDLVANTAIAKMGFPTMAISACYAGPLLNMVLGVGISSTYQILKTGGPYKLDIAPTILVSSTGLITVLLSTLVVVNLNGYCINKQLGWWMIIVYSTCCIINILLECDVLK
ncbi:Sodium/calcium exchanger protein-domain-containing protein [Dichotomocladium elegans]|nr:Sodium/calcium exchanger protein-domain-containing protein [Dichotomocladium elegans]